MKAVYIQEPGGPEALVHGDRPDPEVAPGEVMLRVRGSALNRLDMGLRQRGHQDNSPRIMGCDVAGEVVSISPDAQTSLKIGDRVLVDNRVKCLSCEKLPVGPRPVLHQPETDRCGPGRGPCRVHDGSG